MNESQVAVTTWLWAKANDAFMLLIKSKGVSWY